MEGREEGEPAPCLVDLRWHIPERKDNEDNENNSESNVEEKINRNGPSHICIRHHNLDIAVDESN